MGVQSTFINYYNSKKRKYQIVFMLEMKFIFQKKTHIMIRNFIDDLKKEEFIMIKNFSELVEELKKSTFEKIAVRFFREKHDDCCNVECYENMAYDDSDLTDFLAELDAEIIEYGHDYVLIQTKDLETYKVLSKDKTNRFGLEIPETILFFDEIARVL